MRHHLESAAKDIGLYVSALSDVEYKGCGGKLHISLEAKSTPREKTQKSPY